jgi:hypothetical protein
LEVSQTYLQTWPLGTEWGGGDVADEYAWDVSRWLRSTESDLGVNWCILSDEGLFDPGLCSSYVGEGLSLAVCSFFRAACDWPSKR